MQVEQHNLNTEIVRWTRKEVFAITRKTLADLSGASLEERMTDVFVGRVRALSGTAKDQMTTAFKTSNQTVSVHSAFDLPSAQQKSIETAVKETFAPDAHVQFETAPELVSGIELSTNGHKIAWSIADYLATLEKSAGELLNKDARPDAKAKPDPKAETKPDPKVEAKPDPKAEAKPDPKAETKPQVKSQAKPDPRREPKNGPVAVPSAPKADH